MRRHPLVPIALLMAAVSLWLGCSEDNLSEPAMGFLQVSTLTSGDSPDADGYLVQVDDGAAQPVGPSAETEPAEVVSGEHRVTLSGLAQNCSAAEGLTRSVTVSSRNLATVQFTVSCPSVATSGWRTIPLPPTVRAGGAIWGTSASDLFVSGTADTPSPRYGIWHYDGAGWTEQVSLADTSFNAIWGSSGSDVYAVGNRAQRESPHPGVILHYDGIGWSTVSAPALGTGWSSFQGIWGTSRQDIFLAGYTSIIAVSPGADIQTGLVARFDGQAWSAPMPTSGIGPWTEFTGLFGTSATDVWAVGHAYTVDCETCNNVRSTVAHFDGQQWTRSGADEDFVYYTGVWASAPDDVWVTGDADEGYALLTHYDGTGWTRDGTVTYVDEFSSLYGVWGSSRSDVYAVGRDYLLHYDGHAWTKVSGSGGIGIWGLSREDVFVVREHEILHGHL